MNTLQARVASRVSLAIALAVFSAACGGRERINADCQWTHDTVFDIDVTNRTHQMHLRSDADLMEDLAIRYADAHAGRGARPEWPEARDVCMAKLFAVIGIFAAVMLTPLVSAAGGAAGTAWAIVWEIVRVGNEHMSHRAARVRWPYYVPSLCLAALVVCSFVARREFQSAAKRDELMDLEDPSARSRVLLK